MPGNDGNMAGGEERGGERLVVEGAVVTWAFCLCQRLCLCQELNLCLFPFRRGRKVASVCGVFRNPCLPLLTCRNLPFLSLLVCLWGDSRCACHHRARGPEQSRNGGGLEAEVSPSRVVMVLFAVLLAAVERWVLNPSRSASPPWEAALSD